MISSKQLKTFLIFISIAILLAFTLFVINQVTAVYANLLAINILFANIVLGLLILIFSGLIIVPVVIFFKLPRSLQHPENDDEIPAYKKQLVKRLQGNKLIKNEQIDLQTDAGLQEAMKLLDSKANDAIISIATSVFLTTSISQNGKLDALTILVTQTKMIWNVAHIYWQRPGLKDLINLYGNVGATAFLATEVEDLDISRQIEPILNAMFNSTGKSLPIVGHAAHIITDSILEGSVNAFLTLRVGIIAKRYCDSLGTFDRKKARRNAFIEASGLLKILVVKSSAKVVNALVKATKRTGVNTIMSGVGALEKMGKAVKHNLMELGAKMGISKQEMENALEEENVPTR